MNTYLPVTLTLTKEKNEASGQYELVVNVTNPFDHAVANLMLSWCYDYDDPSGKSPQTLGLVAEFFQVGEGNLLPGETRQFVYPPESLPALLSVVDSLSCERYFILLNFDDESERAMDGRTFGGWVQKEFGTSFSS
jgi:hypothetical protein